MSRLFGSLRQMGYVVSPALTHPRREGALRAASMSFTR